MKLEDILVVATFDNCVIGSNKGTEFIEEFSITDLAKVKQYKDCLVTGIHILNENTMAINVEIPEEEEVTDTEEKQGPQYELQIYYSWGEEEEPLLFETFEEAWAKAKEMAMNEVTVISKDHGCLVPLFVMDKPERREIRLDYVYDSTSCFYEVRPLAKAEPEEDDDDDDEVIPFF